MGHIGHTEIATFKRMLCQYFRLWTQSACFAVVNRVYLLSLYKNLSRRRRQKPRGIVFSSNCMRRFNEMLKSRKAFKQLKLGMVLFDSSRLLLYNLYFSIVICFIHILISLHVQVAFWQLLFNKRTWWWWWWWRRLQFPFSLPLYFYRFRESWAPNLEWMGH